MTRFVGLDVSQKLTSICVVEETGRRLWRASVNPIRSKSSELFKGLREMTPGLGLKPGR
jgi:hypothetical protein